MSSELAKFLNCFAIIANFMSFFLVAPEIAGEERLAKILARMTGGGIALVFGAFITPIVMFIFLIVLTLVFHIQRIQSDISATTITTLEGSFVYPVNIWGFLVFVGLLFLAILCVIFRGFSPRLMPFTTKLLVTNAGRRNLIFRSGIVLFVTGTILQLVTTLLTD